MRSTHPYDAYIRSPEWQRRRQERLQHDGFRCMGCDSDGSDTRLEVHHLTYERFGYERLEDLMTLCHLCHSREHGRTPILGPVAGPTIKELVDRAQLLWEQEMVLQRAEQAANRDAIPLWKRVAEIERLNGRGSHDVSRQLSAIRRRVEAMECKLGLRRGEPGDGDRFDEH